MNIRKTAAVWAAVGAMALAVSCAGADGSGEVSENVSTESLSEEISEVIEEMSDNSEDFSDIFAYRIIGGNVRIVKYIGNDKFAVIPDTIEGLPVKTINASVFSDRKVTELTLPAGIENVSAKMINNTKELQYIYISEGSENYISVDGVILTADGKTLVMYPGGRTGEAEIPEGVTRIGDNAFYGCKITGVSLPETVEEIGISAFEQCLALKEITIPGSVKAIEPYAFCGSGLLNITVSEGVESIGTGAFESTKIMELYLPDSVTETGSYILGSERGARISACEPREELQNLEKYEGMSYRNETALEGAVRTARQMAESRDKYYTNKAYLTDIDGDDFPEMLFCNVYKNDEYRDEYLTGVYRYNSDKRVWEETISASDTNISIYRDRESGGYMEIDSGDHSEVDYFLQAFLNDGSSRYLIAESDFFYPINGYYGNNDGYMTCFECGGKFEIYENKINEPKERHISEETAFAEFIRSTVDTDRYELVGKLDFYELISELKEKYPDREEQLVTCGDFADSPDRSKADFEVMGSWYFDEDRTYYYYGYYFNTDPESDKASVTVGNFGYTKYSCTASLTGEEINAENFEKLAALPCLTSLNLFGGETETNIDLTGIDKLKNLKRLTIGSWSDRNIKVTNAECLKNMDIQWLRIINTENTDFMADLDKVRVLEIGNSMDKPDDHYAAVADMDSLEYITVSVFEINVTKEQEENIRSLRPDVAFCYFKVG